MWQKCVEIIDSESSDVLLTGLSELPFQWVQFALSLVCFAIIFTVLIEEVPYMKNL